MKKILLASILLTGCFSSAFAGENGIKNTIKVTSASIQDGQPIPEKFAYCMLDGKNKTKKGGNIRPQLTWSGAPQETKSFAVVVVDPDVPAKFDDANKEDKTIAEDFPRQNFYHFVLVNIPVNINSLAENPKKDAVHSYTPAYIGIPLINDFAGGKDSQEFEGYDGPCPPWNDARLHHYHFVVYALGDSLDFTKVGGKKSPLSYLGRNVIEDIEKHAIAKGELVGTYSNFVK